MQKCLWIIAVQEQLLSINEGVGVYNIWSDFAELLQRLKHKKTCWCKVQSNFHHVLIINMKKPFQEVTSFFKQTFSECLASDEYLPMKYLSSKCTNMTGPLRFCVFKYSRFCDFRSFSFFYFILPLTSPYQATCVLYRAGNGVHKESSFHTFDSPR